MEIKGPARLLLPFKEHVAVIQIARLSRTPTC